MLLSYDTIDERLNNSKNDIYNILGIYIKPARLIKLRMGEMIIEK